jgi:hypothetical protein
MIRTYKRNAGLQEDDGGSGKVEANLVFVAIPQVFDRIYSGLLPLLKLHWNSQAKVQC